MEILLKKAVLNKNVVIRPKVDNRSEIEKEKEQMMKKIKNSFEFIQINRIKNNQNCDCNSSDDCSCGSETDSIDTSSSEEENEVKTEKSEEKETLIEEI